MNNLGTANGWPKGHPNHDIVARIHAEKIPYTVTTVTTNTHDYTCEQLQVRWREDHS